jgi:hypothetical protein
MNQIITNEKKTDRTKSRKYMYWVDLMRSFGIIVMPFFHCGIYLFLGLDFFPPGFFANQLRVLAIPVFSFLSGYVMFINYPKVNDYKTYIRKKLKYIIPNYLIWGSIVSIVIQFSDYSNYNYSTIFIDIFFIISISFLYLLTGHVWVLYFIYVVILFYIFYPLLLKIINKFRRTILFHLSFIILILAICLISNYSSIDLISIINVPNTVFSVVLLEYFSYFILGIVFASNKDKLARIHNRKLLVILIIPIYIQLYIIVNYKIWGENLTWFLNIIASTISIFIEYLIFYKIKFSKNLKKEKKQNNIIISKGKTVNFSSLKEKIKIGLWKLGLHSGGIYYIHIPVTFIVQPIVQYFYFSLNENITKSYFLLITFTSGLLVLIISYLLVNFIRRNVKKSRYLVGI